MKDCFRRTKTASGPNAVSVERRGRAVPRTERFLRIDLHQYNIGTDLADAVPGDHILLIGTEETEQTKGAGNDDGADTAFFFIEDQVAHSAETPAVATIDHIFFF